ncbi:TPA: CRISPR-associated endonuclease Cas2 [Legionella pneumophila]|uniref:CRISPR-associated endonuclease Cas2 n=1 Tax=Legionella pneumophila TaxID=446 RepID=UPI001A3593E2|nr:CRISPR-associated endonuclease Cas2 [Legionella pneumophila subsp. fraseri]HAT1660420.1 CRISPR-associated endonuclease Cas2 [Legionella pneumophila]MDX1845987.1 CRISPR-associated endonuclease Cas2 [Legionella pneumophila subsp. fraseri]HAT1771913.1 CRISPR-associated endonuclease Cas2 [Legionella pneumophila]HAT1921770.1 CRISPR-associated endonuclease Cas2 [Legionella pneumophila]
MFVVITYDVNVTASGGQKRLRNIAKTCLDYGLRVQNSVFECEVEPDQFVALKNTLLDLFDPDADSLRFYFLGKKGKEKIEHFGANRVIDPLRDPLIL